MKLKYLAIGLMMLFCLNVFGQQQKTMPMTVQPQKTEVQVLEETILQLQAENQAMQKQMESVEKDIEICREDVRHKETTINDNQGHWLTILSIVIGAIVMILGVGVPLILNNKSEKYIEKMLSDAKQEASSAKEQAEKAEKALNSIQPQVEAVKEQVVSATEQAKQAKQAVADIGELRTHVDAIEKKINENALAAEKAAKEAQASQLFTQALSEKDRQKAIELYTQAIDFKPDFSWAYNNRGILRKDLGDKEGAMKDYDKAIELDPNYAAAYNNRADLWLIMGELDKALDDINNAIKLDSTYHVSFVTRGEVYLAMNLPEKAIPEFNHAVLLRCFPLPRLPFPPQRPADRPWSGT